MSIQAAALAPVTPAPYLPALIAGAGKPAALRFAEFFTVNIRDKNTRAAYARVAAGQRGARFSTRLSPNSFGADARTLTGKEGEGFYTPDYRRTAGSSHNAPSSAVRDAPSV
jgi:hypothetical protein